jgi:hypothetical protein
MSTAILLPAMGDPYLIGCWLAQYERVWKYETEKVYMVLTSGIEEEIMNYTAARARSLGIEVFTKPFRQTHGQNILFLLEQCKEEYVGILEDDIFIFEPGLIGNAFKILKENRADVVGSTRCCVSDDVRDATVRKFNLTQDVNFRPFRLDRSPFFWPGPVFGKRETFLATDQHFDPKGWAPGEYIKELDLTLPDGARGDTFVWTSIQLRAMGCRFSYFHHPHAHPKDRRFEHPAIPIPDYPWIHYGSLSTGIMGLLKDSEGVSLGGKMQGRISGHIPKRRSYAVELTRRLAFFDILVDYYPLPSPVSYYNSVYKQAIRDAVAHFEIPQQEIMIYYAAIERLFHKMLEK